MNQVVNFAKVQSTGNDFIVIDCNSNHIRQLDKSHIIKMCDRRLGIGADGLILVTPASKSQIDMKYYNTDGSETAVCGNGLRAVAQFARIMGMVKMEGSIKINAGDGIHEAYFDNDDVVVEIIANEKVQHINNGLLGLPGSIHSASFTNTGVPHLVLISDVVEKINVSRLGKEIRSHSYFEPEGTNVNFVQVLQPHEIQVRTYERGIEDETLSCGTGIVAAAIVQWEGQSEPAMIDVKTNGGNLTVFKKKGHVYLSGPSSIEFVGQYLIN